MARVRFHFQRSKECQLPQKTGEPETKLRSILNLHQKLGKRFLKQSLSRDAATTIPRVARPELSHDEAIRHTNVGRSTENPIVDSSFYTETWPIRQVLCSEANSVTCSHSPDHLFTSETFGSSVENGASSASQYGASITYDTHNTLITYRNKAQVSNNHDCFPIMVEEQAEYVIFRDVQTLSSEAMQQCLQAKAILQWYQTNDLLVKISSPDISELHQILGYLSDKLFRLQELIGDVGGELHDCIANTRAKLTLAQVDIVLILFLQNKSENKWLETAYSIVSLSSIIHVVDSLMKLFYLIPFSLVSIHTIVSSKPVTKQSGNVGMRQRSNTKLQQDAMGLLLDKTECTGQKQQMLEPLHDDRLTAIAIPEIPTTICADIVHFMIAVEPFAIFASTSLRWTAASNPGSIARKHLTIQQIRSHVSEIVERTAFEFELWVGNDKLADGDEGKLFSWTHNIIQIVLDPVIDIIVNGNSRISLNFSALPDNKAFIPIGFIKKKLRSMLGPEGSKPMKLFLAKQQLTVDQMTLVETSMLSNSQLQGFSPICLSVDYNRPERTCITCLDDKYVSKFFTKITENCTHPSFICKSCLRGWIDSRIDSTGIFIPCPECSSTMEYADVKRCTKSTQFKKYDHLVLVASLSTDPDFHWCLSSACKSGQIHTSSNPIFVCSACNHRHCITHKTDWHEDETCAEYDKRITGSVYHADEEASQQRIEATTKACPRCNSRIEKNDGCDHMTCSWCSYQFCWECRCDWVKASNDAQFHQTDCQYHRTYEMLDDYGYEEYVDA